MSDHAALWANWLEELPEESVRANVEQAVSDAMERASAAHPEIELSSDVFFAHVGARCVDADAVEQAHLEDLWLACAALEGSDAGVAAFDSRFRSVLRQAARRVVTDEAAIADIVQGLLERLLVSQPERPASLSTYAGRSALASWLAVVAFRHARRAQGGVRPGPSESELFVAAQAGQDPELVAIKREHAEAFSAAFEQAMNDLTPRERTVLRFHLIDGLSIDQIGKLESVHRATAARWIAAARKKIHDSVRADLRRRMNLTRSELESLIRVVRSQLNFSIKRHLA